jgi:hypothetical protein
MSTDTNEIPVRISTIPGYPGYLVTACGQVQGPGKPGIGPTWLRPGTDAKGYKVVCISIAGVRRSLRVHRLALLAFQGEPPEGKPLVRHLDGDPSNNRLENLAYGSFIDNERDKIAHGTVMRGARNPQTVLTEAQVLEIRRLHPETSMAALGARYGCSTTAVRAIVLGRNWAWLRGPESLPEAA